MFLAPGPDLWSTSDSVPLIRTLAIALAPPTAQDNLSISSLNVLTRAPSPLQGRGHTPQVWGVRTFIRSRHWIYHGEFRCSR